MLFALNSSQEPGQEEERADLTRAKVLYKDGLWVEAMNALPASMSAEKQVLKRLQVSLHMADKANMCTTSLYVL